MSERTIVISAAVFLIALALLGMAAAHERHYKNRKWQMLEGRVSTIERIVAGEHD